MKQWSCLKCGKETDRRQGLCDDGDEHEWIDTREYLEIVAVENARQQREAEARRQKAQREAEDRRQKAAAAYKAFLNSAEGKEQHIKIANSYLAPQRAATRRSLILGIITILALPVGCVAFYKLFKSEEIFSLPLLIVAIAFSFPYYFYNSWQKRAEALKAIPKVKDTNTGRECPLTEAVQFLASRDISQDFAYEDEYGASCVPKPFIPDTSNTETAWRQKLEHARKLGRRKKWAEAAKEYQKVGAECGFLAIAAPAWELAALCYKMLDDERTQACYRNAVRGYQKLVNQGEEGAAEKLAEVEQKLAEVLNRNVQDGSAE